MCELIDLKCEREKKTHTKSKYIKRARHDTHTHTNPTNVSVQNFENQEKKKLK